MKLWTGDEWRSLSDNEALHRLECGYTVLEDDDPRTLINEAPTTSPPEETPAAPATEAADALPRNNRKRRQ